MNLTAAAVRSSPIIHDRSPVLRDRISGGESIITSRRGLQPQEQLRTKILQSFTPAPPARWFSNRCSVGASSPTFSVVGLDLRACAAFAFRLVVTPYRPPTAPAKANPHKPFRGERFLIATSRCCLISASWTGVVLRGAQSTLLPALAKRTDGPIFDRRFPLIDRFLGSVATAAARIAVLVFSK